MPKSMAFLYRTRDRRNGAGSSLTHLAHSPDLPPLRRANDNLFYVGDQPVAVMSIDQPAPFDASRPSSTQSQLWPSIAEELGTHAEHTVVASLGEDPDTPAAARAVATAVLRVAAHLASQPDVIGVHWQPSGLALPREPFLTLMHDSPDRPSSLIAVHPKWFGRPRPDGDGVGAETRGLHELRLPEIRHGHTGDDPQTVAARIYGLADYLIANGPVIRDGDTIGAGEEAITVRLMTFDGRDYLQIGFDERGASALS